MDFKGGYFDYEMLDAMKVIRQALVLGEALAEKLPGGHANLKDQFRRALASAYPPYPFGDFQGSLADRGRREQDRKGASGSVPRREERIL